MMTSSFHEVASNGGPKLDSEVGRQSHHEFLADKMVEQTNQAELSFVKAEHLNGGKTGQAHVEDYSYDKDVVEIKLPDTVLSPDYGVHFVKDVCIDEGVPDQRTASDKVVDQKVSIHFDSSEFVNGDLREEISADSTKTALELKSQIVILPVMCETDGNTGEQNSCKKHGLEDSNTADVSPDSNDDELNPKQLVPCHEVAQGCQEVGSVIPESNENRDRLFNGEATHQVSSNDCYETGTGIALETSNIIHNDLPAQSAAADFSVATPEEVAVSAALDMEACNQANHYNPFIAYGSLDGTWEPDYSLPTVVDAASIAPTCPVEKTHSFSDLVNRALEGFDPTEMGGEAIIEENRLDSVEESSGTLDVQASEQCNGQRESLTNDVVAHEMGTAVSLSTSNGEHSDVKSENGQKYEINGGQDTNDFNPRDAAVGTKVTTEDITDSKSSTLVQAEESVVQQNGHESAKVAAQTVLRNPFESSFSGPSITSGPLTPSGHIPYSGNISLRSESSTTSARSFAFPVLQNEWNSSPVKMAKADRRRPKEDRGWGYRILCCKF